MCLLHRSSAEDPLEISSYKDSSKLYWEGTKLKNITEQEARAILSERGHKNIVTFTFPKGGVKEAHEHPFDSDIVIVFRENQNSSG